MSGHATNEELKVVERLEAVADPEKSPLEDLLELGQVYIEPCHREEEAIALFEAVLLRDPNNPCAKFWMAHCYRHYRMDPDSLQGATVLLRSVSNTDTKYAAAADMLLADLLDEEDDPSPAEKIPLLEASARKQPEWVHNHESLAWAYLEAGRPREALEHIRRALANVIELDPHWSITTRHFEESITGRTGYQIRERLAADLEQAKAALTKEAVE